METQFYILLTMKTVKGTETFAKFFIGNHREWAYTLFQQLKGSEEADENNILFLDFMETKEGLPLNLKMKSCTLDQVVENCKLITKEMFKLNNLERVY